MSRSRSPEKAREDVVRNYLHLRLASSALPLLMVGVCIGEVATKRQFQLGLFARGLATICAWGSSDARSTYIHPHMMAAWDLIH